MRRFAATSYDPAEGRSNSYLNSYNTTNNPKLLFVGKFDPVKTRIPINAMKWPDEKKRVHMNVVPRSTKNTNGETEN